MNVAVQRNPSIRPFLNPVTVFTCMALFVVFSCVMLNISEDKTGMYTLHLLAIVQLTPFLIAFSRQHYNYIAFIMFNHFFTYTITKYNQVGILYKTYSLAPETVESINQLILCTVLIIASYGMSRLLFFHNFAEKKHYQMLSLNRLQLIIVAGYVISVPVLLPYIPSWLLSIHFATMAADMVLLLCSNSPGNERLAFYLRLGVFISTIMYFLETGFLSTIGNLAGYLFISACLQKDYRRLLVPICLAILASGLQNIKMPYRDALKTNPNMTVMDKIGVISSLAGAEYFGGGVPKPHSDDEEEKDNMDALFYGFARAGDDSLERVLTWTPSRVPFWNGETYASIPFMFIPRYLWPEKPTRHFWNEFGRRYGFLGADDYTTSVGVNFIAEGYMNFGYPGMYAIALFFGLFVALVERLSYYFMRGYFYFTFMVFLMPVMYYGNDLTSIVNSVVIVGCVLILFRNQILRMALRDDYS